MSTPMVSTQANVSTQSVVIASPGGSLGGGGMGTVTRQIAQWLDHKGADNQAVVIDPRGDGSAMLWPVYMTAAVARLLALRIAGKADILHLQVSERSSLIRKGLLIRLGRLLGMKTVLHHHGAQFIEYYLDADASTQQWVMRTAALADMNIVLGKRWETFLREEVGIAPAKIRVLHNATADIKRPPKEQDAQAGPHLLLAANLSPRKGVTEFLQALKTLVAANPSVRATLAGGGEVDRYRAEAEKLGLGDAVTFTGWIDHVQLVQLLCTADALVLPSYDEGLPMVILEALSANVPVVATPVGSIPEVLENGKTCLLVEPGDVPALGVALQRILFEDGLGPRLAQEGRCLFESQFDIDHYMAELLDIYAGLGR